VALAVICSPLSNQKVSVASDKFPILKDLKLADFDYESAQFQIGVLVGLDHYHSFFTGKVVKVKTAGELLQL
jgi:hypothetical protein